MNERLHTRGLISGRQHVSDMDSGSLREDLLAGRSDMVRNTIMTAAYREATAVLEESRGEEAGDFLAGFVEGCRWSVRRPVGIGRLATDRTSEAAPQGSLGLLGLLHLFAQGP